MAMDGLGLEFVGKTSSNIKIMWFFKMKIHFSFKNGNLQSDDWFY